MYFGTPCCTGIFNYKYIKTKFRSGPGRAFNTYAGYYMRGSMGLNDDDSDVVDAQIEDQIEAGSEDSAEDRNTGD